MARLTDKTTATAVTLSSLIHIVNTGDTSQNSSGSSYKTDLGEVGYTIGGYQYYTAVTVTSGQILTLNSVPVTILPAPSTNQYYDYKVYLEYDYGTIGYTGFSGVRLIDISGTSLSTGISLSVVENQVFIFNGYITNSILGSPIRLYSSADPTSGDGTIKLKIWYNIVDFG